MYRIEIKGIVQGVGFRPYIYRKAVAQNSVGYVKNMGHGVEIIIDDGDFLSKLTDLPPLAKIEGYKITKLSESENRQIQSKSEFKSFEILESAIDNSNAQNPNLKETQIPADIFMCNDCLNELNDSNNRRNNYYFITCTNCGPRFTIIENYPYDRPLTSMNEFKMCNQCEIEYTNPMDRRYHAQTIACKNCGTKLKLLLKKDEKSQEFTGKDDENTIKLATDILKNGEIIAIKGVGGFHICSLTNISSVKKVKKFLGREHKPFAIMVKDFKMLEGIANPTNLERELLSSPARPIVVIEKLNNNSDFSKSLYEVSELNSIGVMLPYTALHYMLFNYIDEPIVMTSCNIPGEPVNISENETRINPITKSKNPQSETESQIWFLTHERRIVNRCDDSVLKVNSNNAFFLRRSRGYAPLPIKIPIITQDTIAVGAELNNTVCTTKDNNCYLSQYIGETSNVETYNYFKSTIDSMIKLTRLNPKIIACDLHPGYNSTMYAKELAEKYNAKLVQIQHHKAHVASVAAEHGLTDYIGIALDGLGFGDDGNIWGGEIFDVSNSIEFERVGHLEEQPQLGADTATIYPKKMLFGILSKFLSETELVNLKLFDEQESKFYIDMLDTRFNVLKTTSSGRVLDAVSALLGVCDFRAYDGRPAMMLESYASSTNIDSKNSIFQTQVNIDPIIAMQDNSEILMTTDLFKCIYLELQKDFSDNNKRRLAILAELYIAKGVYEIAKRSVERSFEKTGKTKKIVLSGGVAYNKLISEYLINKGVLVNKEIPSGDGGICYGQAYLANLIVDKTTK
jgi:hydrogenase maturation protein HypF